ncbi:Flp family type IVb pilin [Undibacter mobilis]|uniref:Flp family type IVb pilin n=1 Tax=Undibacter mobilis TaxID=2292256 RepID=A0A371B8W3_9BRAD|nr:Flp family type IVb pilin [Undibacter mobilis]RDV03821.1 Flp family type IVb pilin [Undibacter mobilis]
MRTAQEHRTLLGFIRDENGATAIEYSLIAAGIASAIVAAVSGLGTSVNGVWEKVGNAFN